MNIKLIASILAMLALVVGLGVSLKPENTSSRPQVVVGAVASPDIQSPYISVGGVRTWYGYSANPLAATTTICSLQSPAATSTLKSATFDTSFASSSALLLEIGLGANTNATTTRLAMWTIPASGKVTLNATSTALEVTLVDGIVAPNRYVNFNIAGAGGVSGSVPTGKCSAVFQEI